MHQAIFKNFADAILDGAPLIAPAEEGIHSVELGNAMLLSSTTDTTVRLPMDAARFEALLQNLIAQSDFRKEAAAPATGDLGASFNTAR